MPLDKKIIPSWARVQQVVILAIVFYRRRVSAVSTPRSQPVPSVGANYLLIIDYFSRYPETQKLNSTTSEARDWTPRTCHQ